MWLLSLLKHREKQSCEIDVCCKGPQVGELAEEFSQLGANLYHLPQGQTPWRFVTNLKELLVRRRYDVLHVHTGVHSSWAVRAANRARVPVVTTFHNTQFPRESVWTSRPFLGQIIKKYARYSLRFAVQHSDVATAVSQGVSDAVQQTAQIEDGPCQVVYLGVADAQPLNLNERVQKRKELDLSPKDKVLLHVGSLSEQKNHMGLLKIFRSIRNSVPNAKLLIAGMGPLQEKIQHRIKDLGLESDVRMLGLRKDVSGLMAMSDLLLFPSYREGLSLTLMDASAANLPIVASEIPGNLEATCGGANARLHATEDYEAMAASACALLQQKEFANELTCKARAFYEKEFSLAVSIRKWRKLYDALVAGQASGVGESFESKLQRVA